MLWLSLAGVIGLQIIAVHWPVAQNLFGTSALTLGQWGLAAAVASLILLLEEARKLLSKATLFLRPRR